jgi:hypothetical protein
VTSIAKRTSSFYRLHDYTKGIVSSAMEEAESRQDDVKEVHQV